MLRGRLLGMATGCQLEGVVSELSYCLMCHFIQMVAGLQHAACIEI